MSSVHSVLDYTETNRLTRKRERIIYKRGILSQKLKKMVGPDAPVTTENVSESVAALLKDIINNYDETETLDRDLDLFTRRCDRRQKKIVEDRGILAYNMWGSMGYTKSGIRPSPESIHRDLMNRQAQRQALYDGIIASRTKDFPTEDFQRQHLFESVCRECDRLTRKYEEFMWLKREIKVEFDYETDIQNGKQTPESLINLNNKIKDLKTEQGKLNTQLWKLEKDLINNGSHPGKEDEFNKTHKLHFEQSFRLFLLSRRLKRGLWEVRSHDMNSESESESESD